MASVIDDVAGGLGDRIHRFDQRHAGGEHGRQRAGVARHGRLVEDVADHRNLQRNAVQGPPELRRALFQRDEADNERGDARDQIQAVGLHPFRQVDHELGEGRQVGAEALEQVLKLRHHEVQQDAGHDHRHHQDGNRVGHGLAHLFLQRLGFFLVGGNLFEQRFQGAGLFAGIDQVHVQLVEVQGVLAQGLRERGAALDVGLDAQHHLAHGRFVVTATDDLQRLHQRHAGGEHGRDLAAEHGDVEGVDLALALGEQGRGLAHRDGVDALLAQAELDEVGSRPTRLALDAVAFAIKALPFEGIFLGRLGGGGGHSGQLASRRKGGRR